MLGLFIGESGMRMRKDLPEPEVCGGETLIEVLRAGVCSTDLALMRGYLGFRGVPGHEFVGRALGGPFRGKRVVGEINAGCGRCESCLHQWHRHCPHRTVLGILGRPGAFSQRIVLPTMNLHEIPDEVPDDFAVFVEPLAAAFRIVEQVELWNTSRCLVIGDGKLGILVANVLGRRCRVVISGHHRERAALLPESVEWREELPDRPQLSSERFDVVVEATGRTEMLARAAAWVRAQGTVVLKTTSELPGSIDLAPLVVDEITVQGSRCGPFEPAIDVLLRGDVPVERMIEARYPLERADEAIRHASKAGVLKVLICGSAE